MYLTSGTHRRTGFRKKLIIPLAIAIGLAGAASVPYIKSAYQKHAAYELLTETNVELSRLDSSIIRAKRELKDNEFLMTEDAEAAPLL